MKGLRVPYAFILLMNCFGSFGRASESAGDFTKTLFVDRPLLLTIISVRDILFAADQYLFEEQDPSKIVLGFRNHIEALSDQVADLRAQNEELRQQVGALRAKNDELLEKSSGWVVVEKTQ